MLSTNQPRTSRRILVSVVVAVAVGLLAVTSLTDPSGAGGMFVGLLLIPGLIGGGVALAIRLLKGRPGIARRMQSDSFAGDRPADVINVSRIRVAGIGGLGMVVVAVAMGVVLTRVGETLALGVVGGAILAGLVIYYRSRQGPLTPSEPGGRAYLVRGDDEEITPAAPRKDGGGAGGSDPRLRGDEAVAPTRI